MILKTDARLCFPQHLQWHLSGHQIIDPVIIHQEPEHIVLFTGTDTIAVRASMFNWLKEYLQKRPFYRQFLKQFQSKNYPIYFVSNNCCALTTDRKIIVQDIGKVHLMHDVAFLPHDLSKSIVIIDNGTGYLSFYTKSKEFKNYPLLLLASVHGRTPTILT